MKRLLRVKEYELITCNQDYQAKYACLPLEAFSELENFIRAGVWEDNDEDMLQFLKLGYRKGIGPVISVNNYVGLIQLKSGYQIEILPKISFGGEEDRDGTRTKRIFIGMLKGMLDIPGKLSWDASLQIERMPLCEIFISLYLQKVDALLRCGLKSAYLRQEDNLHYFKGKLLVSEHLRQNIVHKERFYTTYEEYHINRPENQILKATLLKLQKISDSAQNLKKIRQQLMAFGQVEASVHYQKDFAKVVIDRSTKAYKGLMRWSYVFLFDKSFTGFSGEVTAKALLFPMERVFEAYMAKEIRRKFSQAGWEVSIQDTGYYLFDTPQKFALRPDLVIEGKDGRTIIMDTKWKRLNATRRNYGIAQGDMYQMYAYAKKYRANEVWLLYPLEDELKETEPISYQSDDGVRVSVYFVDVAHIQESLEELLKFVG